MNYEEFKVTMPAAQSGDWRIEVINLTEKELGIWEGVSKEEWFMGRGIPPGEYRRLSTGEPGTKSHRPWMSDTPAEIMDHMDAIQAMRDAKSALITGLGLGLVVQAAIRQPTMRRVTVVELEQDVINLVGEHYEKMALEHDVRLRIVHGDAMEYTPSAGVTFDVVWHDIWPQISASNLPQMKKLHRKYAKRARWQGSWARHLCAKMDRTEKYWDALEAAL